MTTISVEMFPGVLQSEQNQIRRCRDAIEVDINLKQSEAYLKPSCGLECGSPEQEPIPSVLCGSESEKHEDFRRSNFLRPKVL